MYECFAGFLYAYFPLSVLTQEEIEKAMQAAEHTDENIQSLQDKIRMLRSELEEEENKAKMVLIAKLAVLSHRVVVLTSSKKNLSSSKVLFRGDFFGIRNDHFQDFLNVISVFQDETTRRMVA